MLKNLYQLSSATLPSALSLVTDNDAVLFRQDSCYLIQSAHQWPTQQLFALKDDMTFRQLAAPANVTLIDDLEWVNLCVVAQRVISC